MGIIGDPDGGVIVEEEEEVSTTNYPMWKVIMHNDPVTTMDFVVGILRDVFQKEGKTAVKIMMEIHETGSGLAGVYMKEHAEMRIDTTHSLARTQGFPLKCTLEKA